MKSSSPAVEEYGSAARTFTLVVDRHTFPLPEQGGDALRGVALAEIGAVSAALEHRPRARIVSVEHDAETCVTKIRVQSDDPRDFDMADDLDGAATSVPVCVE